MKKTTLALSAALIFSGAANADVFLKQTETGPTAPEPTARTLWIGKNAVRMESAALSGWMTRSFTRWFRRKKRPSKRRWTWPPKCSRAWGA